MTKITLQDLNQMTDEEFFKTLAMPEWAKLFSGEVGKFFSARVVFDDVMVDSPPIRLEPRR